MKKILLTGGNGFIGKKFLEQSQNEYIFYIILRNKKKNIKKIIKNKNLNYIFINGNKISKNLYNIKIDYYIHLATHYTQLNDNKNLKKIIKSNIEFPLLVINELDKKFLNKVITIGSMHEHYKNKDFFPYNLYASSKRSFEIFLEYYKQKYSNINFYNLKFYESYSHDDKRNKIIPIIKQSYHLNKYILLNSPNLKLNFLHVEDIVSAIKTIINKNIKPNTYQIKSKKFTKIRKLIFDFNKNHKKKILIKELKKKYTVINFNLKKLPFWKQKNFIENDFERIINEKN